MTPEEREKLKSELRREIMDELSLSDKTITAQKTAWGEVQEHLNRRVQEVASFRSRPYWQLIDNIRNIVRGTFGLSYVKNMPVYEIEKAVALVDNVIDAIRQAKGIQK